MTPLARTLLSGYAEGVFPMAEAAGSEVLHWVDPPLRGILPLDRFHISRTLARTIRRGEFAITFDHAYAAVINACADRDETWINAPLFDFYIELRDLGIGHSVEIWDGSDLVGGVFGLEMGGAFFGESMFSRRSDTSKLALAYLVDRLVSAGFTLFDTQFLTPHLQTLGAVEIPRVDYRARLAKALELDADFNAAGPVPDGQTLLQRRTQTS